MAYASISKPSLHFNTKLYTGNGSTQSITGVGFQPDFTLIKNRTSAEAYGVFDSVRGVTKMLSTANADAETTTANSLTAFGSDGFSVGANNRVNQNTNNIASWNWKAGTTSGITTNGSSTITPTGYSFNATSGISVIKYSGNSTVGAGVPHGLGAVPKMIIIKRLNNTDEWCVYHNAVGNEKYLRLNTTDAQVSTDDLWNDTTPDATNFILSGNGRINQSGGQYIAYCFAEKVGYSKFGQYTGNANADGTFIYTGFSPAFVMIKQTTSATDWTLKDSKRPGYNQVNDIIYPNLNNAEEHGGDIDILSNGFKCRTTADNTNKDGNTFIYMGFAEEPLVANVGASIPATAR